MICQLNYCDSGPTLTPITIAEGLDQRMFCQRLVHCLTQHPCPLAMDNAHRRQASHESGIKIAVELGQSLVYREPPYPQLQIHCHQVNLSNCRWRTFFVFLVTLTLSSILQPTTHKICSGEQVNGTRSL